MPLTLSPPLPRRYRAQYACNDFWYKKGMGTKLFDDETNPGTEMYFCDSCQKDKNGVPYIVGHLQCSNGDTMDAPNHLRAAMFVIDRAAVHCVRAGVVNGKVPRASYILNLSDLHPDAQCTVSGTGYGANIEKKMKKDKITQQPRNKLDSPDTHIGVKPHLPHHYPISHGMPCLKEALRLLTTLYPELLEKIYFVNAPWWFSPIFAVFSLWVKKDTRQK